MSSASIASSAARGTHAGSLARTSHGRFPAKKDDVLSNQVASRSPRCQGWSPEVGGLVAMTEFALFRAPGLRQRGLIASNGSRRASGLASIRF